MTHADRPDLDDLLAQQARVRALAGKLVRDAAAADDVVQEALLAELRRPAGEQRGSDSGRDWMSWALTNLIRDRSRGERRRARREVEGARPEALPSTSEAVMAAERQRELVDSVLGLEEPYRTVVLLRYFEDLPPREIVRRTGYSSEAVKKQLQRGLGKLRDRLEARLGGDGAWAVALLPLSGKRVVPGAALLGAGVLAKRAVIVAALIGGGALGIRALWWDSPPRPTGTVTADLVSPDQGPALEPAADAADTLRRDALAEDRPSEVELASLGALSEVTAVTSAAAARFEPSFRARVVDEFGEPLRPSVLAEIALQYRLNERGLRFLGEPSTVELRPDRGGRIASERVPVDAATGFGHLVVSRGEFAILAVDRATPESDECRVFVLPSVRVAGRVVDAGGAPAAGTTVALVADLESLGTFQAGIAFNPAGRVEPVVTDAGGRFDLGRVPRHGRFELQAGSLERGLARAGLPEEDRTDLVLTLAPPERAAELAVTGRVVAADGAPVAGAIVHLGWFEARAETDGRFRIEAAPEQLELVQEHGHQRIAAIAPDGRFAQTEFSTRRLGEYVLRIPHSMASLSARIIDSDGAPIEGASVFVLDGSPLGSSSATLENDVDAERRMTDDGGRFELVNLEQRPYALRVLRSEPFLVYDIEGVVPGTEGLTFQVPAGHVVENVRGRALDLRGRPLAGIQVRPYASQSLTTKSRMDTYGTAAVTDEGGRFELARLSRQGVGLDFDPFPNDRRAGAQRAVETLDLTRTFDVTLDLECDFMPTLREGAIDARLRFLDVEGRVIRVKQVVVEGLKIDERVQQRSDGTFSRLFVPQRVARVEVESADGELLRAVDLDLSPLSASALQL